jgi:hypothetical protein
MNVNGPQSQDGIRAILDEIRQHLQDHPADTDVVITEINSMVNKMDPGIRGRHLPSLSLVRPDFHQRAKLIRDKVTELVGKRVKIPDLRFEADRLARQLQIPLPNSTRKNNETLLQWFDTHWDRLEPHLAAMQNGSSPSPDS